ncbi:hypothetical protein BCR36DRAFT_375879 [Piromyces finnis]|uniref:Uncharacterized protein n=1 Tax=Piromyces finnis TaxID=1754191 RepID=A0A1Y1UA06_9FUNG|nr:hypothetical protein BCR36DRAFT_375879 [Piromyces finnis]|eukprot:ORX34870.1 hypothetical protein BCR36DRAFT_375879 [Piromyces finnis]
MECIDNYCNNYYVNGQKNIEKNNSINPDSLKSEKVNDYINIIKIDSSNSDNNLHVSNNCNQIGRSASGVNQDNYLSLCRQSSNYSSTIVNDNSKYSSATTVNRNNSINCHNSSYVEEILKDHHEDMIQTILMMF